ncbi:MAG: Hpt domain-containing protein [Bacteroidales bacterium]|jgi:HPt (histidine-containing phosphotransfer) domain-containing protein|nr:Hpt domain-containing protein [Bacteroidales bacterium]
MEYKSFNPDYLMNVSGGELEIMEEIVAIFRNQIPEFVNEMKSLLESGRYIELGLLAHKAKGSVTVMGMEDTARMLKEFELQAKAGINQNGYQEYIARFEKDAATVLAEIDHFMSKKH